VREGGVALRRTRPWVHALLFLLTVVTTTGAGILIWASFEAGFQPDSLRPDWSWVPQGLWYSGTILAILGCHELGHYLACRYYRIDASLPYFLPAPLLTGTIGAFIRIREPIRSKRILFDVGVAGPIAGFLVAVPTLLLGISLSRLVKIPTDFSGQVYELGEPLLFQGAAWLVFGTPPDGYSVNAHPMAFAAWFGLLATALNLFPIGQLDGGHISYAVLGPRWSTRVTLASVAIVIGLTFVSSSWIVWSVLLVVMLFVFGPRHPRTVDEDEPLDRGRLALAAFSVFMFVVCFTPAPLEIVQLLPR
jgi:membrane-associated protease RseP (regulator of RpoE activity)